MHYFPSAFIGSFINVIVILVIVRYVVKAIRKSRGSITNTNPNENKDRFENFLGRQMNSDNAPRERTQDSGNLVIPPSYQKNIQYGNKLTDKDQLQLKRCKNCGGEIPLTMMKCTICGANQWGCSLASVVIFVFIILIALIVMDKNAGYFVMRYIHNVLQY